MPKPEPPIFLIIADQDARVFFVEGPMTDDQPWQNGVRYINGRHYRRIVCGPTGADRDALAAEFQRASRYAGVPPGGIVRPRE